MLAHFLTRAKINKLIKLPLRSGQSDVIRAFCGILHYSPKHKKKASAIPIEYPVYSNAAALLYIINLGAIDIGPWASTVDRPMKPDYITIDLDPSDSDFSKAVERPWRQKTFDRHKIIAFPQSSGKTGIDPCCPAGDLISKRRGLLVTIFSCTRGPVKEG